MKITKMTVSIQQVLMDIESLFEILEELIEKLTLIIGSKYNLEYNADIFLLPPVGIGLDNYNNTILLLRYVPNPYFPLYEVTEVAPVLPTQDENRAIRSVCLIQEFVSKVAETYGLDIAVHGHPADKSCDRAYFSFVYDGIRYEYILWDWGSRTKRHRS